MGSEPGPEELFRGMSVRDTSARSRRCEKPAPDKLLQWTLVPRAAELWPLGR